MLFRRVSVNSIIENVRFSFLDCGRTSSVGRALNWREGGREVEGLILGVAPTLTV